MNKYELLWEYQQADVASEIMKRKISRSPQRLKLIKLRDSIQEKQTFIETLEAELVAMIDRLDILQDAVTMIEEKLKTLQVKIQDLPASDAVSAKAYVSEIQSLLKDISSYDEEVKRIKKDAGERATKQKNTKKQALALKVEFDQIRKEYNVEYQQQNKEYEELKAAADEKGKLLDPEIMKVYLQKKQRCNPPIAKLVEDRCGGCNMSFPSSVLHAIKQGENIECENCGRLIIV